jgi:hypothetical protein
MDIDDVALTSVQRISECRILGFFSGCDSERAV